MRVLQTNEQLSRLSVQQQWVGSGATSLSAAHVRTMWSAAERRFAQHVCLRHIFRPFLFGIPSIYSLPEAGSWERQYAPPVLHCCCIMPRIMPIPSLQLKKKNSLSLMQRSRGFGHGVVVSKICYVQYSDCVQDLDYRVLIALSVVTCDCCKPTNHCRDWAFSHSGLEAGLPAFQLPMYSMWDALPKKVLFHMFVSGIHAFCEI